MKKTPSGSRLRILRATGFFRQEHLLHVVGHEQSMTKDATASIEQFVSKLAISDNSSGIIYSIHLIYRKARGDSTKDIILKAREPKECPWCIRK